MPKPVKLIATVKLLADADQKARLLATMARVNEACTWLAERAFELQSADKLRLQKLYYASRARVNGPIVENRTVASHGVHLQSSAL